MKKNLGTADSVVRILIAIIFAILYFTGIVTGTIGIILLVLMGTLVLTSLVKFCPLYLPFNINTGKKK